MATSRDTFESVIYVNNEQAQDATEKLRQKLEKLNKEYEALNNAEEKDIKLILKKKKQIDDTTRSLESITEGTENYKKALDNLSEHSMEKLVKMQRLIESELKKTKPDTEEWKKLADEHARVTERLNSLRTAYKHVGTEQTGLAAKLNKIQGLWVVGTGILGKVATALRGIAKVTKEVINASQTMGDKWNNAMSAMKTTTEAFFMALSSGNWDAFNGGLREAIKNAHRLAEDLDTIGSYQISEGVMQSKYLADYSEQRATALDTDASPEERRKALEQMENDMEHYSAFVKSKGEEVFKTLQDSFEAWKGLTFDSEEEFESFFVRLYEYTNIGKDEAVENLKSLYQEFDDIRNRYYVAEGNSNNAAYLKQLSQQMKDAETSFFNAYNSSTKETQALYKAWELNDKKLKDLSDWFKQYADSVRLVSQYKIQTERTSNRVNKQLSGEDDDETAARKREQAAEAAYQAQLKRLEKERYATQQHYAEMYMKGEIDKKAYDAQMIVLEDAYLAEKLALNQRFGKDTDAISQTILDRQIKRYEEAKKTIKALVDDEANFDPNWEMKEPDDDEKEEERERREREFRERMEREEERRRAPLVQKAEEIRASIQETSLRSEYETEMMWVEKLHEKKMLSEEEYEAAKLKLRIDYAGKAAQKTNEILGAAADLSAAIQSAETANLEAEYQARLTAAGDNAEKREQIEAEYEAKKLELEKKYADISMAINIAQTIANGAAGVVKALADPGGVAGTILAATIGATTAAQIATIIAQRNAIKSQTVSMPTSSAAGDFSTETSGGNIGSRVVTGYARGGYTEDHTTLTTVGERGTEWIAPHWMVKQNPITFANLESYRRAGSHGRSGSVARGFADGGYTPGAEGGENGFSAQLAAILSANTDASNRLASLIEKGVHAYVVLSELNQAQDKQNRFNEKTSR